MRKFTYYLFVLAIFIASCQKENPVDVTPYAGTVPVNEVDVISDMTNDFGWKLFQEIAADVTDENVLISPLSVQIALSMAANGANGSTVEEMLNVLGCAGCILEGLNEQTSALRHLMEEQSGSPRLVSANGFFYDPEKLKVNDYMYQASGYVTVKLILFIKKCSRGACPRYGGVQKQALLHVVKSNTVNSWMNLKM